MESALGEDLPQPPSEAEDEKPGSFLVSNSASRKKDSSYFSQPIYVLHCQPYMKMKAAAPFNVKLELAMPCFGIAEGLHQA